MVAASEDTWLTGILAKPAYRVTIDDPRVTPELHSALKARLNGLHGFLYCKIPTAAVSVCSALEDHGFRVIDTNVILETGELSPVAVSNAGVRMAVADDRARVEEIAGRSFTFSRFHLDPQLPRSIADRIKAEWAGNFFGGKRGDYMVVAEEGGTVKGFLQLLRAADHCLTIDLIAIAAEARNRGLAAAMIGYAIRTCGAAKMRVGTQAANLASLRLYEKLGFRTSATSYVLHLHRP